MAEAEARMRVAAIGTTRVRRLTNFYPRYDDANDQVDPVSRVEPVVFQRIEPRYRLSTSETRDSGLGPAFIEYAWRGSIVDERA